MFLDMKNRFRTSKKIMLAPQKWKKTHFCGLRKWKKNIFFKKPEFRDLTNHWGWFPQLPWWPRQWQTSWVNSLNPNSALAPCVKLLHYRDWKTEEKVKSALKEVTDLHFLKQQCKSEKGGSGRTRTEVLTVAVDISTFFNIVCELYNVM